ncbi:MAG: glycosyl hydrolase family 28 protein [Bacteroidota bacterium]|nr:glycosyl hydrolase family 28 protein [Bacteroidota bacterium]
MNKGEIISSMGLKVGFIILVSFFMHNGCSKNIPVNDNASSSKDSVLFSDFDLKVNGQNVAVQTCRVSAMPFNQAYPGYQRPLEQTELAGFAYWDMKEPVKVEILSKRTVNSVKLRPASLGIQPTIKGNLISFTLDSPHQIVIEVNGMHQALHLFANPPENNVPDPNASGVRYFAPGVHNIGRTKLQSNESVYIAPGAVVYGSFYAVGASNIRISGRGIIDVGKLERGQGGGAISLSDCSNVTVEGIVMRDPDVWCCTLFGCSNVTISNVKLIGLWRYNSDGIDVCNSQEVVVQDCFIRSFDDALVVKGLSTNFGVPDLIQTGGKPVSNVRFSRNVIWCDWGKAMEIGAETVSPEITGIVFENCDVIRVLGIAMDIMNSDRAAIHDIRFENIRLEIDDWNPTPRMQLKKDEKYQEDLQHSFCPMLIQAQVLKSIYSFDSQRGTMKNITFKDISVTSSQFPLSTFNGFDSEHRITDVIIQNLRFNSQVIQSSQQAGFTIGPYVNNIQFF